MSLIGKWIGISFAGKDLQGETISGEFIDCDFSNADLRDATLSGTFVNTSMIGAKLAGARYDPDILTHMGTNRPVGDPTQAEETA